MTSATRYLINLLSVVCRHTPRTHVSSYFGRAAVARDSFYSVHPLILKAKPAADGHQLVLNLSKPPFLFLLPDRQVHWKEQARWSR
jgi:hypothetical protein